MQKYIDAAVNDFKKLLTEQLERAERLNNTDKAIDFTALSKIIIGICDGDGIGPIIVSEAKRVLELLLKDEIAGGKIELRKIEGLTIENRIKHNAAIPADTLAAQQLLKAAH